MARISIPTQETAPSKSQPILDNYRKVLGMVPNFFALISQSPDALKAIADMHATLGKSLGPQTRERIHIAIAEVNGGAADPPQTILGVTGMALPGLLIEIEVTALVG